MPINQLTKQQIKWAQTHDWFVSVTLSGFLVVENSSYSESLGAWVYPPMVWTGTFKELRNWAGY